MPVEQNDFGPYDVRITAEDGTQVEMRFYYTRMGLEGRRWETDDPRFLARFVEMTRWDQNGVVTMVGTGSMLLAALSPYSEAGAEGTGHVYGFNNGEFPNGDLRWEVLRRHDRPV